MTNWIEDRRTSTRPTSWRGAVRAGTLALATLLAACTSTGQGEKEAGGTILGGALGGLLGAEIGGHGTGKVVGAALGTFLGAAIGNEIGKSLDRADRLALEQAQYRALENTPSGERSEWVNPDTGHHGWVEPQPAYQNEEGRYCREFTQKIFVGGQEVTGYGTACRQPDGSWKIVDTRPSR
ncbi:MAG: glycine zipper 2TM domain-containing protein [Alphaproteobacteria bacterium]|nr:MAG: glycine zipper 2TM domain-containing protein [Alphaproteobacteria bacterium]